MLSPLPTVPKTSMFQFAKTLTVNPHFYVLKIKYFSHSSIKFVTNSHWLEAAPDLLTSPTFNGLIWLYQLNNAYYVHPICPIQSIVSLSTAIDTNTRSEPLLHLIENLEQYCNLTKKGLYNRGRRLF